MWNVVWNDRGRVWGIRDSGGSVVRDKWWDLECGVLMCDVERYVKHGSGMWNWV